MRNGMVFPNTPIFQRSLKTGILISLCCYVMLLGVIELTHDHDHDDHAEPCHSAEACAACFHCSQHIGEEIELVAVTTPLLPNTTLPFYEVSVFLPLRLTTNTWTRAPPVFSNELPDFAWRHNLFPFYIAMLFKGFGCIYTRTPFGTFYFERHGFVCIASLFA